MHYIVFIPNVRGANPDHLKQAGLEGFAEGAEFFDAIPGMIPPCRDTGGMVVFWSSPESPAAATTQDPVNLKGWYGAEANEEKGLVADRFFIGWDPENPPGPADLHRAKMYSGHSCPMADGNEWLIPSYMRLDHVYRMGPSGKPKRGPAPCWQRFCKRSEEIQRELFAAVGLAALLDGRPVVPDDPSTEVKEILVEDGVTYVADALSINYRLNLEIACALGLLSDDVLPAAIACSVDLPEIIDVHHEKKNTDTVAVPVI